MDDKIRIEKLVQTIMQLKGTISLLKNMSHEQPVKDGADEIIKTIEFVIQANAMEIGELLNNKIIDKVIGVLEAYSVNTNAFRWRDDLLRKEFESLKS